MFGECETSPFDNSSAVCRCWPGYSGSNCDIVIDYAPGKENGFE